MKYRFVGQDASLTGPGYAFGLTQFGKQIELPEEAAAAHIAQHAQILTEDAFQSLGFTEKELAKYPRVPMHDVVPEDPAERAERDVFIAKRDKAWQLLATRQTLPSNSSQPVETGAATQEKQ